MIRENLLYKIMSGIHIVFFTSILCMLVIVCSGTMLTIPAIAALFPIGREVLYKKIDVNESFIKKYFRNLKERLGLMRFFPVNLLLFMNLFGFFAAVRVNFYGLAIACIAIVAMLITLIFYIAGFDTFMPDKGNLIEVVTVMFLKPLYLISIYTVIVLLIIFFNGYVWAAISFCGSFLVMGLETVIFLHFLQVKNQFGMKDEDAKEFATLVQRKD